MDGRRWAAALALATGLLAGNTAAAAPTNDRELATSFEQWMKLVFAVPDAPELDESLRKEMGAIAAAHLARLHTLLPAWIAEERARSGPGTSLEELHRQTTNRLYNEIALWRLESPGAAYDAAWRRAILKPGACDMPYRESYLGVLMTWLQAAQPADRAVLLEGERTLLARWGHPRKDLPPRPAVSLADDERAGIARLAAGDEQPGAPMAPIIASVMFASSPDTSSDNVRCALHQWGLARALRRGDPPGQALTAWRYATLRTVQDWNRPPPANSAQALREAASGYPHAAYVSAMKGRIQVRVDVDAQGRYASGRIEQRDLAVPGIVGTRPVAFETALDEASLAKASSNFKPEPAAARDGATPPSITIDWKLQ